MRVIAGTAKGRILLGPKGARSLEIRPVLDKVKGAIFNILGGIEGCHVLDLFAGTGAVGIEALSRGAAHVTFVDDSHAAIVLIRRNLERCNFLPRSMVIQEKIPVKQTRGGEVLTRHGSLAVTAARALTLGRRRIKTMEATACERSRQDLPPPGLFDLIFVDPPYDQGLVNRTLRWIAREKMVADGGTVVVEHSPREPIATQQMGGEGSPLSLYDQRKYGQTYVSFLRVDETIP